MRISSALTAVMLVAGAVAAVPTAAHAADGYAPTLTAVTTPSPKAMREANGYLFVSTENSVVVLSSSGAIQETITGMFGASGMVVSTDDSRLYVALAGSGQVAVVDTSTLAVTDIWTAGPCVKYVALSGSTLFFSYGCEQIFTAIGALSILDGSAQETGITDTFYDPPLLVVAGSTLVVGATESWPSAVTRYDISGSTLTKGSDVGSVNDLEDLAVSPDGTSVATAGASEQHLATRSPDHLTQTATFDTGTGAVSVAYSHDGRLIAGGLDAPYQDGMFVFDRTTGLRIVSGPVGDNYRVLPGTLTFSADDGVVYALAQDDANVTTTFLVTSTTGKPMAGEDDAPLTFSVAGADPVSTDAGYSTNVTGQVRFTVNDTATTCPEGCTGRFVFNPGPDEQIVPGGADIPAGTTNVHQEATGDVVVPATEGEYDIVYEVFQLRPNGSTGGQVERRVIDPLTAWKPTPVIDVDGPASVTALPGHSLAERVNTRLDGAHQTFTWCPDGSVLQFRSSGSTTWKTVADPKSGDPCGVLHFTYTLKTSGSIRVVVGGIVSASRALIVPTPTSRWLFSNTKASTTKIVAGGAFTLSTLVKVRYTDGISRQSPTAPLVFLQRRYTGSWSTIRHVRATPGGAASLTIHATRSAHYRFVIKQSGSSALSVVANAR
jgi:YVTN family beta-propeller protein